MAILVSLSLFQTQSLLGLVWLPKILSQIFSASLQYYNFSPWCRIVWSKWPTIRSRSVVPITKLPITVNITVKVHRPTPHDSLRSVPLVPSSSVLLFCSASRSVSAWELANLNRVPVPVLLQSSSMLWKVLPRCSSNTKSHWHLDRYCPRFICCCIFFPLYFFVNYFFSSSIRCQITVNETKWSAMCLWKSKTRKFEKLWDWLFEMRVWLSHIFRSLQVLRSDVGNWKEKSLFGRAKIVGDKEINKWRHCGSEGHTFLRYEATHSRCVK